MKRSDAIERCLDILGRLGLVFLLLAAGLIAGLVAEGPAWYGANKVEGQWILDGKDLVVELERDSPFGGLMVYRMADEPGATEHAFHWRPVGGLPPLALGEVHLAEGGWRSRTRAVGDSYRLEVASPGDARREGEFLTVQDPAPPGMSPGERLVRPETPPGE